MTGNDIQFELAGDPEMKNRKSILISLPSSRRDGI